MSRSVPNSPRNQHELMKSNTLPQTAVLDAASTAGNNGGVSASPGRKSRGASLTNFLKKLSPKLRQSSNSSPVKHHKERQSSASDATVEEEPSNPPSNSTPTHEMLVPTKSNDSSTKSAGVRSSKVGPKEEEISSLKPATTTVKQLNSTPSHTASQLIAAPQPSGSGSSPSETNLGAGVCIRRTHQPPRTLNILNKIVVHPPPLEMERVKNKIASVESIGSCSLDVDGTGSESSVTVDGRASSVSQRTLRSASGGAAGTSSSTPKASVIEAEEESMSERRSKHVSKLFIPNGHGVSEIMSKEDSKVDGEQKKLSYIGISCSVSGYSDYSCYDSKVRRQGLRSRDNSPARLAFNQPQQQRRTVDIEIDEVNGGVTYSSCEVHTSEATVIVNGVSETSSKTAAFAMWRASSEDGIINGGHRESKVTTATTTTTATTASAMLQQLGSTETLTISTTPTKSLIQQRIERLYGPGALAQGFRRHAELKNRNNEQLQVTKLKVAPSSHPVEASKHNGTSISNSIVNDSLSGKVHAKDGQSFIDEMNKERDRINAMIRKNEDYLKDEEIPEDARGKIRAAVGKANLLLSRKFRQFQGLCEKNLTQLPDEPFPTTVEDLTGFWDMVLIQVDDIDRSFEAIRKASENEWRTDETDSRPEKNGVGEGKKVRKVKANSTKSDGDSGLSKSRAEARRKLMELKCKGRQQMTGSVTDSTNGIEIYVADDRGKLN